MGKKVKLRVKVILVLFFTITLILAYSVWDLVYGSNIIIESKSKEYLLVLFKQNNGKLQLIKETSFEL
ncbi:MAG TPA: hypothetical protein EYQ86_04320, partial [Bacteroidetes bacterium]|nr:hypothetical protein [Bacteroidota bacterium]